MASRLGFTLEFTLYSSLGISYFVLISGIHGLHNVPGDGVHEQHLVPQATHSKSEEIPPMMSTFFVQCI